MNTTHRPCLMLAIVLSLGIMAGKYVPVPLWGWLIVCTVGIIAFCFRRVSWLMYVSVFCLGAVWMAQRNLLPLDSVAFLSGPECDRLEAVEGVIDSDIGWRGNFELRVKQVLVERNWRPASGKMRVNLGTRTDKAYMSPSFGQLVRVHGKIRPIFDGNGKGGFSYRQYMQEQGVYWYFSAKRGVEILSEGHGNIAVAWAMRLRRWMEDIFYRYLVPREAGFVAALVLGDRSGMPRDLNAIFVNTGTAHILAISGMNMAIIAVLFFFVLRLSGVSRRGQFLGTIVFLFAYAFLSGWSASVVRACIMSAVILAGFAFEYESDALNSLGLAALILLFMDPKNLFDVGFQLSFAAVAGILILYGPCERLFVFLPAFVRASMSVSLAAWAGTAGIIFYHFRMITPVSILANIPIVPLADLVMVLGLGLAAGGGWCAYLGYAFAGCLKAALSTMVICALWFNQVPYGHFLF